MEPTKRKASCTTTISRKTKGVSKPCRDSLVQRSSGMKFSDEDRRTYWAIISLRECLNKKNIAMQESKLN